MAINWNMPQQPVGGVVGQLPAVPGQGGIGDFTGGVLSGIAQGQGIQQNAQAIEMNKMRIDQAKQAMADEQALRGAGTGDKYMEILKSQGRFNDALTYQKSQLDYQNALLNNKASILKLNDVERARADRDNTINVAIMGQVSQLPPEQQQQAYQQYRSDMLKQYPDMTIPEQFNENSFASVMRTNEIINKTQTVEATEKVKTLDQLQQRREQLERIKIQKENKGQDTKNVDRALNEVDNMIQTHTKNVQTQVSKDEKIQGGLVDLDLGTIKENQAAAKDAGSTIDKLKTFKKLNEKFPTGIFAQAGLNIGKAYSALTGQKLDNTAYGEAIISQGMDFVMQRIQGTKGAVSDKEMAAFAAASPNLKNTKEGNDLIIDTAIKMEERKQELVKRQREYMRKNGSLEGFDEQWNSYIQDNPILDTTKLDKMSTNSAESPFQEGKIYTDAQGNKARYVNGSWEEIK